jgi:hypothetical protein
MIERWLPVPGYEGSYSVSNLGRIRSEARAIIRSNGWKQTFSERIRATHIGPHGYPLVNLKLEGKGRTWPVHILVCMAFHGPRPLGKEVAHGNGDRADACAANLRWATPAENNADKLTHGTNYDGERHHNRKITDEEVRAIRQSRQLQRVLADRYGVTQTNISAIKRGVSRKAA